MSNYPITRALDGCKDFVPEGHDRWQSYDGKRAYLFDKEGNVVSAIRRPGESYDDLKRRMVAAIDAISVNVARDD